MSVKLGTYYNLKAIRSGDRLEVYKYSKAQERGFEGKNKAGRKGKGKADKERNRREVLNKARNQIIRLVNCNPDLMTFISLTYRENMKDIKASKADLNKCLKELQRDFTGFKYLYVLEFQQRGAIHYHMLCNLPVPVETAKTRQLKTKDQKLLENQFHETYWEHGWVDIRDLSQEGNTNAGLYVSVYLIEDLFEIDLKGSKCYGYSRNLSKPIQRTIMTNNKPYEVIQSFEGYDIKYASSYNMKYEVEKQLITNQVNYFDLYKRREDYVN
jgi:hypothetical protein